MKPIAAAYYRVSTEKQSEEGFSIENQRHMIEKYREGQHYDLPDDLKFEDNSPATRSDSYRLDSDNFIDNFLVRPQLRRLLKAAQEKRFQHLIVYSRDRISRVVEDTLALELFFKRFGIEVHYIKQSEDFGNTDDKIKRLLHILFISLAEMEGELLSSRVKDGGKACVLNGYWAGGRPPFGYLIEKTDGNTEKTRKQKAVLVKSEFESQMVDKIYESYIMGYGYREIARLMSEEHDYIKWTKGKIEAVIKNSTYTGKITWNRRGGRRKTDRTNEEIIKSPLIEENTIVSEDIWDEIKNERNLRNSRKDAYYYNTKYVLKNKLICSECNGYMKVKNPGRNKTKVYICHKIIPCDLAEQALFDYISREALELGKLGEIWGMYNTNFDNKIAEASRMKIELEKMRDEACKIVRNLQSWIETEKEKDLQKMLLDQLAIHQSLEQKYQEHIERLEKYQPVKRSEVEFMQVFQTMLQGVLHAGNKEEFTRIRREFVLRFIKRIEMSYVKETKLVVVDKVIFTDPSIA